MCHISAEVPRPVPGHARRSSPDYTPHKTDESDCVLIGRLATELHCYIPEELDETWAHLRHLGRIRGLYRAHDELGAAWQDAAAPAPHRKEAAAARLAKAYQAWDDAITVIDEA